jgi:DNA-binding PadR family transcriptional regulator
MGAKMISTNEKCSCLGYNLDKLVQPKILIPLMRKKLHGYSIVKKLEEKAYAKKVFTITEKRRECLSNWGTTLENYCAMINIIVDDIKSI